MLSLVLTSLHGAVGGFEQELELNAPDEAAGLVTFDLGVAGDGGSGAGGGFLK